MSDISDEQLEKLLEEHAPDGACKTYFTDEIGALRKVCEAYHQERISDAYHVGAVWYHDEQLSAPLCFSRPTRNGVWAYRYNKTDRGVDALAFVNDKWLSLHGASAPEPFDAASCHSFQWLGSLEGRSDE